MKKNILFLSIIFSFALSTGCADLDNTDPEEVPEGDTSDTSEASSKQQQQGKDTEGSESEESQSTGSQGNGTAQGNFDADAASDTDTSERNGAGSGSESAAGSKSNADTDASDCPYSCRSENWCETHNGIEYDEYTCAETNRVCCDAVLETETQGSNKGQ